MKKIKNDKNQLEKEFKYLCDHNVYISLDLFINKYKDEISIDSIEICFWRVCYERYTNIAKILMNNYQINVNYNKYYTNGSYSYLIHCVSRHKDTEILKLLLSHKDIDINVKNSDGSTALMIACDSDNINGVKLLLYCKEIDVNAKDIHGETALMIACQSSNYDAVKLLLDRQDVDINIQSNYTKETALMYACKVSDVRLVHLILRNRGKDIRFDLKNKDSESLYDLCKIKNSGCYNHGYMIVSRYISDPLMYENDN